MTVKNETENGVLDSEENYGEKLIVKNLEIKREPVESLEHDPMKRSRSIVEFCEVKVSMRL